MSGDEIPARFFTDSMLFKDLDITKPAFQPRELVDTDITTNTDMPTEPCTDQAYINKSLRYYQPTGSKFTLPTGPGSTYDDIRNQLARLINCYLDTFLRTRPNCIYGNLIPFIVGTPSRTAPNMNRIMPGIIPLYLLFDLDRAILYSVMALIYKNDHMCHYGSHVAHPLQPQYPINPTTTQDIKTMVLRSINDVESEGQGMGNKYVLSKLTHILNGLHPNEYFMFLWDTTNHIVSGFMYFEYIINSATRNVDPIHQNFDDYFHITAFCGNIPHNARGALLMPALLMKQCTNNNMAGNQMKGIILDSISALATITLYNSIGFNMVTDEHNNVVMVGSEKLMVWCTRSPEYRLSTPTNTTHKTRISKANMDLLRYEYEYNMINHSLGGLGVYPPEIEALSPTYDIDIYTEGFPDDTYSYVRVNDINDVAGSGLEKYRQYLALARNYHIRNPLFQNPKLPHKHVPLNKRWNSGLLRPHVPPPVTPVPGGASRTMTYEDPYVELIVGTISPEYVEFYKELYTDMFNISDILTDSKVLYSIFVKPQLQRRRSTRIRALLEQRQQRQPRLPTTMSPKTLRRRATKPKSGGYKKSRRHYKKHRNTRKH